MSRLPEDSLDYPSYMMLDDEREREEDRAALGYQPHPLLTDESLAVLAAARKRRAAEDAAADAASDRYYLFTGKGRAAAERVDAATLEQLEATKEKT